eukprot:692165-Hanusia_phi.AAC.6
MVRIQTWRAKGKWYGRGGVEELENQGVVTAVWARDFGPGFGCSADSLDGKALLQPKSELRSITSDPPTVGGALQSRRQGALSELVHLLSVSLNNMSTDQSDRIFQQ